MKMPQVYEVRDFGTVQIHVVIHREAQMRMRIAQWLFKLAAAVLRSDIEVHVDE